MSVIILDFGSGNTCKNSEMYIKKMYDQLKEIDHGRYEIIVKWQLFKQAGENIPLNLEVFDFAYQYGTRIGYKVTASIFDLDSLKRLLTYKIPFVKIANNRKLDYLIKHIPDDLMVYISSNLPVIVPDRKKNTYKQLWCISKYPAVMSDYDKFQLKQGCCISDHCIGPGLFHKYNPFIIEWHYKLENSSGLDAGDFAKTPEELSKLL